MPTDPVTLLREGPQPAVYVCLSCMRQISLMEVWQVQEPERSAPTYTHHTVDGHPVVRIDGLLPTDAGGCEELRALVREWQIARRPSHLPAPGVDVVETYRHAVLRMTVVDEALARFNLDGPAGGALVGQTTPTESTGPFTDEYAVEMLTHLARTLPEIDEQHSCLRGALAIKAIAARARGVGRAISNARAVYLAPPEAACVHVGDVVNAEPVDVDPDLVVSVEAGMVSTQQGDTFPLSSVRHVWKPAAPPEAAPTRDCADDVCQAAKHDGILCADGECDYRSGIRKPPSFADDRERIEGLAAIMAVSPSDEDRVYAASLRVLLAERDAALNHHCSAERPCLMCQREREARAQTWAEVLAYVEQAATRQVAPGQREAFLADVLAKVQSEAAR